MAKKYLELAAAAAKQVEANTKIAEAAEDENDGRSSRPGDLSK